MSFCNCKEVRDGQKQSRTPRPDARGGDAQGESEDADGAARGQRACPSVGLTAEIIRLVGRLFEEEGVDVSGMRFADVCALALLDAAEHDEQPRPDHVRSLVRLVKPQ